MIRSDFTIFIVVMLLLPHHYYEWRKFSKLHRKFFEAHNEFDRIRIAHVCILTTVLFVVVYFVKCFIMLSVYLLR